MSHGSVGALLGYTYSNNWASSNSSDNFRVDVNWTDVKTSEAWGGSGGSGGSGTIYPYTDGTGNAPFEIWGGAGGTGGTIYIGGGAGGSGIISPSYPEIEIIKAEPPKFKKIPRKPLRMIRIENAKNC